MSYPEGPFGNTCPFLRVATKHNVDYSAVLCWADLVLHGREPVAPVSKGFGRLLTNPEYTSLLRDLRAVADHSRSLGIGSTTSNTGI